MDWPSISADPNAPEVRAALRAELERRQMPPIWDRQAYFAQVVKGKSVLDLGVVDHHPRYRQSGAWLHQHIRSAAAFCVGVDTNATALAQLAQEGYPTALADVTSEVDLEQRFDVIVAGELIGHVAQLESFLSFCSRHAHSETRLLLSTPNPHWIGFCLAVISKDMLILNAEHVSWVSPSNILELCRSSRWRLEN